jgi:Zn-dependent protease with chaperone function
MADSSASSSLRTPILKQLVLPALSMLLVPACGVGVARYAQHESDVRFRENVSLNLHRASDLSAADRDNEVAFFQSHPLSHLCEGSEVSQAELRQKLCGLGSDSWQFTKAQQVSWMALVMGLLALLSAMALAAAAHWNPQFQFSALAWGWRLLSLLSAFEMLVQGIIATWLSYWITVLLFNVYVPKLIFLVGALAAFAVFSAVRGILTRPENTARVEGELLSPQDAVVFQANLKALAAKVGTEPPSSIIAGIDDNFFVTETPLQVGEHTLRGRSLFVSLPLLRVLESAEADAVLAHELAHLKGGDTTKSARLGPLVVRYEKYLNDLKEGAALPAFYVMNLFKVLFDLAVLQESRARELRADALAVSVTSSQSFGNALLKVSAYSSHRNAIERELFEGMSKHAQALAIQDRVHSGLRQHLASAQFTEFLKSANTPHPFDSHPPLLERLREVRCESRTDHLFEKAPTQSWVSLLPSAAAIEERLWTAYESRFNQAHEMSLTYRYLPATDEERTLVEKHFPRRTFQGKNVNAQWRLSYLGLESTGSRSVKITFKNVKSAQISDGYFSTQLVLALHSGEKIKINLREVGATKQAKEEFKEMFSRYWSRDSAARELRS